MGGRSQVQRPPSEQTREVISHKTTEPQPTAIIRATDNQFKRVRDGYIPIGNGAEIQSRSSD